MVRFYRHLFSGLPREVWRLSLVTVVHRSGTMVLPFLTLYLTTFSFLSVMVRQQQTEPVLNSVP